MKKVLFILMIIAMPLFSNAQEVKHYYIYNIVNFEEPEERRLQGNS